MRAGCEEGFQDPLVVKVEGELCGSLEVAADVVGGEGEVLSRGHVGEDALEGVVERPVGMAGGIGQAENHRGEVSISGHVLRDCPGAGQSWSGRRGTYLDWVEEREKAGVCWGGEERGAVLVAEECGDCREQGGGVGLCVGQGAVLLRVGAWCEWVQVSAAVSVRVVAGCGARRRCTSDWRGGVDGER